ASSALTINGDDLAFKNAVLTHGSSRIAGNGIYNSSSQTIQLNLNGSNFNIADIPQLQHSRISITGTLDFTAQVLGAIAAPDVSGDLRVRHLTLNGEEAGDYLLNASSHGPDLRLTGDRKSTRLNSSHDQISY